MSQEDRYKRQSILPEIGEVGQKKISSASVLCVGAGGLGCPALLYLVAAGVGRIGIVDFDVVDLSNLQRQVLFSVEQIGQNKARAAKERLSALNPDVEITIYPEELSDKNAEDIFAHYDVIIDGTDNFSTKFLINDACVKIGKPFIYGSILGFDGQVACFNYQGGPCYRCLFPQPPQGHIPNCAEAGVIGAVAGIIGTTQAMEALKIIVDHADLKSLSGVLWMIDMRSMESRSLSLSRHADCPVCSKDVQDIALSYAPQVCMIVRDISPEDARTRDGALMIDVREEYEWESGHIEGAQHIALSALMNGHRPNLPKDGDIILYCQKGVRSKQAAHILISQGYSNLHNMSGGYEAWLF